MKEEARNKLIFTDKEHDLKNYRGFWRLGENGEGIRKYKLIVTK